MAKNEKPKTPEQEIEELKERVRKLENLEALVDKLKNFNDKRKSSGDSNYNSW